MNNIELSNELTEAYFILPNEIDYLYDLNDSLIRFLISLFRLRVRRDKLGNIIFQFPVNGKKLSRELGGYGNNSERYNNKLNKLIELNYVLINQCNDYVINIEHIKSQGKKFNQERKEKLTNIKNNK